MLEKQLQYNRQERETHKERQCNSRRYIGNLAKLLQQTNIINIK